jgi:hypothetical protein
MVVEFESRTGVTGSIRWIQTLTFSTTQNFERDHGHTVLVINYKVLALLSKLKSIAAACHYVETFLIVFQQSRIREF